MAVLGRIRGGKHKCKDCQCGRKVFALPARRQGGGAATGGSRAVRVMAAAPTEVVKDVVDIPYGALLAAVKHKPQDGTEAIGPLNVAIEKAYGDDGLGILTISGVPRVMELRQALLPLASRVAALDASTLASLEDPESLYSFGWSHGKEKLEGGRPDTKKGSFYANPLTNVLTEDPTLIKKFPGYCRPNIWPSEDIPELEGAFMELGQLVCDVGMLVGVLCDQYCKSKGVDSNLRRIIGESRSAKSRLLHYFPEGEGEGTGKRTAETQSNWCGWHYDHGSLTGLISGIFMEGDKEVQMKDPNAGLYIKDRNGTVTKAVFAPTQIAFQIGQTSQILSGGLLKATPHCVRGATPGTCVGVARNSFATFMQPHWEEPMEVPEGFAGVGVKQWRPGTTFGEFSEDTVAMYY